MPPIGSRSILSIALGPRHDLIMSATLKTRLVYENGWMPKSIRFGCSNIRYLCFPSDLSVSTLSVWCDISFLIKRGHLLTGLTHNHHRCLHIGRSGSRLLISVDKKPLRRLSQMFGWILTNTPGTEAFTLGIACYSVRIKRRATIIINIAEIISATKNIFLEIAKPYTLKLTRSSIQCGCAEY